MRERWISGSFAPQLILAGPVSKEPNHTVKALVALSQPLGLDPVPCGT